MAGLDPATQQARVCAAKTPERPVNDRSSTTGFAQRFLRKAGSYIAVVIVAVAVTESLMHGFAVLLSPSILVEVGALIGVVIIFAALEVAVSASHN